MTDQIFISYSKKDSGFAHKLADDLEAAGFKIWIDRSLQVGEDWEDTIENQIRGANEVIVVLSPNAVSSKWVQHEGSIAYGLDKQMFPVLTEDIETEDHPLWAKKYQYHSFVGKEYQTAFDALVAALTPPNPIQDLLDQQVQAYQQTGELIGETILRVIEENVATLEINREARDIIQKSRQSVTKNHRTKIFWRVILAILIFMIIIVVILGATGQIAGFVYRPLEIKWVTIPKGEFIMGSSEQDIEAVRALCPDCPLFIFDSEIPQQVILLEEYQIGKYEITNREYRQCVKASVCASPRNTHWQEDEYDDYPVTNVDWDDANTFCQWSGARLPTGAEWEKAARGTTGTWYPWGNKSPSCALANFSSDSCRDTQLALIGSYSPQGDSVYGVADMVGNVWEWIDESDKNNDFYSSSTENLQPVEIRSLRGGSFLVSETYLLRPVFQFMDEKSAVADDYGFRCAK